MTKPDDIPQDVWDAAASAYFGAWNAHDEMFNPASNSISDGLTLRFLEASARAIMAEREACPLLLDEGYDRIGSVTKRDKCTHGIWDWDTCDQCAAAAIRNRSEG